MRDHTLRLNLVIAALFVMNAGCGTAMQKHGTEQLLLSDSVDRAIDQLDLSPLAGRTVFLDTSYMQTFKGNNIHINSDYIISALRQKMTTTGCRIEPSRTEADYILEARIGALGTDTMEVTYGVPSSNGIGVAASAITGAPGIPAIPELSVGKRNNVTGVSKVVVFAYHRDTGIPVWQSGAAIARSDARDSWFLGVGPLSRGSIHKGTLLAGSRINSPFERNRKGSQAKPLTIADKHHYVHPALLEQQLAEAKLREAAKSEIGQASHEKADAAAGTAVPASSAESGSTEPPPAAVAPAVSPTPEDTGPPMTGPLNVVGSSDQSPAGQEIDAAPGPEPAANPGVSETDVPQVLPPVVQDWLDYLEQDDSPRFAPVGE